MIPDTVFTLDKAKAHLRVDHALEDALITAFLDAAVGAVERYTRRAWTKREWTTLVNACDLAPCGCDSAVFHAELSPATAKVFADSVEFPAASVVTSTRHGHTVVSVPTWTAPADSTSDVGQIDWTAQPMNDAVPADVYAAVMLHLGDLYENREAQMVGIAIAPNPTAEMLLRPYVIEMTL